MMFTPDSFLQFLKALIKSLNVPILIFAIGIIIIVAVLGANVPENFRFLVYAVTIGALVGHFVTTLIPLLKQSTKLVGVTLDSNLSGAILNGQVRGYASLRDVDRERIVQKLQDELSQFFGPNAQNIFEVGGKYWVEFLGGDFIVFVADENHAQSEAILKCLALGVHLQLLAKDLPCILSITLNWGEHLKIANVVKIHSLYGNAIYVARRMNAFTEGSHFLISEKVEDKLANSLFYSGLSGTCDSLLDAFDRIGLQSVYLKRINRDSAYHLVKQREQNFYNFFIVDADGNLQTGNKLNIVDHASVDFYDTFQDATDAHQTLINHLMDAEEVVLVDITHKDLVSILRSAFAKRNNIFWKSINVVFPNRANVQSLAKRGIISDSEYPQLEEIKRKVQIFFESQEASLINRWSCLEYGEDLPFIGNRFVQRNDGLIQFGVVFTGDKLLGIPYFEFRQRTRTYDQFSRVFDLMLAGSTSISEWDLFGKIVTDDKGKDQFSYSGVVNRAKISVELKGTQGFSEFCFPVVLIMLYTRVFGDFQAVIQERTYYNATSDIGTYSNISGRISTDDVRDAKGKYFTFSFDKPALVATSNFNQFSGWSSGQVLSDEVWKQTAIRELGEELGLEITPERLKYRGSHYLPRDDGNLYFQIYSLLLDINLNKHELEIISQRRPYTSLRQCTFTELETLWRQKKLNRLLQNKFLEVFVTIFSELQIKDSPRREEVTAYIQALKHSSNMKN